MSVDELAALGQVIAQAVAVASLACSWGRQWPRSSTLCSGPTRVDGCGTTAWKLLRAARGRVVHGPLCSAPLPLAESGGVLPHPAGSVDMRLCSLRWCRAEGHCRTY